MRRDMEGSITMSENQGMKPRLLLVEDDSVSCSFMAAALQALPAEVDTAASLRAALAHESVYDLWLLDANLPDGSGTELLAGLRARFPSTPALAHTADDSPALHAQLLAAGFDQVLVKPLTAVQLQQAAGRLLGLSSGKRLRVEETRDGPVVLPLWDQATALAALNGSQEHVATLRRMFLQELAKQHDEIHQALRSGDLEAAKKVLHQLKARSGFVGAMRLNAAAALLEKSLFDAGTLADFSIAVSDTQSSGNA
jgi:DNA-binding response OmpR family regulator